MELVQIAPDIPQRPTVFSTCLDWLEIRFLAPGTLKEDLFVFKNELRKDGPNEFGPFQLMYNESLRSRAFETGFDVYYEGSIFGFLLTNPYSAKVFNPATVQLKIENSELYSKGVFDAIKKFAECLELKISDLGRFDIANDGFSFVEPIRRMLKGEIVKLGRAHVRPYCNGSNGGQVTGFHLGSRQSRCFVRSYPKMKRIESEKKYYILDFWKQQDQFKNKVETAGEYIERLELQLKSSSYKEIYQSLYGSEYKGLTWGNLKDLFNSRTLARISNTFLQTLYQFAAPGFTNASRAKRKHVINWANATAKKLVRQTKRTTKRIRSIQTSIKTLYQFALHSGKSRYKKIADEIILNTDQKDWFDRKKGFFEYEYQLAYKNEKEFFPLWTHDHIGSQLKFFGLPVQNTYKDNFRVNC